MPRLKSVIGWLGATTLFASPALWAADSTLWLERMAQAVREQSYHGSYVYERSGIFTTQDIWKQVGDDGIRERLLQTAGRYQEWLRQDGRLVCATNSSLSQGRSQASLRAGVDPEQLLEWYSMRNLGTTRIASRDVTVIGIQPKDGFRFAHELYIDHETGLLLKSLLVDESRELLERFQFTTISFDEENYSSGLEPGESCREVSVMEPPAGVDVPFWEPQWIPPGFTLGERQIQSINGDGPYVSSQIYSDGLTSFTLFVEPLGRDKLAEDLRARLGPTVAVSRRLMADSDFYLATVVGEIPPRAAERIADSLSEAVVGARR